MSASHLTRRRRNWTERVCNVLQLGWKPFSDPRIVIHGGGSMMIGPLAPEFSSSYEEKMYLYSFK